MPVQGKESLTGALLTENTAQPIGDTGKKSDQVDFGAALAAMLTAMTPQSVALAPKESFGPPKTSDSAILAINEKSPAYIAGPPPELTGDDSHSAQLFPLAPVANPISPRGKNQPLAAAYHESLETVSQPGSDNSRTDPFVRPALVATEQADEIASAGSADPTVSADSAPALAQTYIDQSVAAATRKRAADETASDSAPSVSSSPATTPTAIRSAPVAAEQTNEVASAGSAGLADPIVPANFVPAPAQTYKDQTVAAAMRKRAADETAGDSAPSVASSPAAAPPAQPRAATAHAGDTATQSEGSNTTQRSSGHAVTARPGSSPGSPREGSDPARNVQVPGGQASGQPAAQASQQVSANPRLLQPPDVEAADREHATVQRDAKASVDRGAAVNSPRGEEPPAAPVQASAPVRPPLEAGRPSEAMRTATLKVELGDGNSTQATVRERSGSVEVKIVAPNQLAEQKISAEIVGLKYALDNAGLRLARAEVSYQTGGGGGRDDANSDRNAHRQQPKKNEIFTLNEVNK